MVVVTTQIYGQSLAPLTTFDMLHAFVSHTGMVRHWLYYKVFLPYCYTFMFIYSPEVKTIVI